MKELLRIRGFMPYVAMLFLNAFVDLGHKIVIQNTVFKLYDGQTQIALTAVVNALILIPFILLFSPAGFLSNRFAKPKVMRAAAWVAVLITLAITACYAMGWFEAAFAMTVVLAAKSAIYSPAKYGYIREIAGTERIATANGVVQATTTVAILAGVFIFSILFEHRLAGLALKNSAAILQQLVPLGWLLVALSAVEVVLAYRLPLDTEYNADARAHVHHKPPQFLMRQYLGFGYLRDNLRTLRAHRTIWLSIIGLSVYWSVAQVVLAAFPAFAKERLHETNTVVIQGVLACTGIGVMLGALLAGKISRKHIEMGLIPTGALGMALCLAILPTLQSTAALAVLFAVLGMMGGFFIIPLNALVQYHAHEDNIGTVLAGANWMENVWMLTFLGLTIAFAQMGINSVGLFIFLTLVVVIGAGYTVMQLPHSLVRFVVSALLRSRYRITVAGFDHLPRDGAVLLLGNHISWIDWALVQIACPRRIRFVMQREIYNQWFLKPFVKAAGAVPIASGHSKAALETINSLLLAGEVVCLFPEGAITRNGQLGEFRKGFERTTENVNGVIVPFYLQGLWGSRLSRASTKINENRARGIQRNIVVAFGEPIAIGSKTKAVKQAVFELSIGAWQQQTDLLDPLPLAWLKTAKRHPLQTTLIDGGSTAVTNGINKNGMNNLQLLAAVLSFSRQIRQRSAQQYVGLLLPTTSAGIIANLATLLAGKTVVNLNYTASPDAVQAAIEKADLQTVYTARQFIRKLEQKNPALLDALGNTRVFYLEDIKHAIGKTELLLNMLLALILPARLLYSLFGKKQQLDDVATILFSSGSEGKPKGVMLSHRNIVANCLQVSDVLNTQVDDVVIGCLPLFHSFGLTVTTLMPLLEGVPVVCHPDPTDVVNIAKSIARYRATVLCGTSTFLRLYVRNNKVHPLMLRSLRVVVAGAEKLAPAVRESFKLKFQVDIFEGYGATETTPVASVNIPDQLDERYWHVQLGEKFGTVGMPLPGTAFRIVDPNTLATLPHGEDGLILIAGTQVMPGYLDDAEKTASVIVELDGRRWYKSGDKGHLDDDGFLVIVDRYSRFAKIAGEMISLTAVEDAVRHALTSSSENEIELLALNVPDSKKGEKVVLLYVANIDEEDIRHTLLNSAVPALMMPAEYMQVDSIPKLGSGKIDFMTAKQLALSALAELPL